MIVEFRVSPQLASHTDESVSTLRSLSTCYPPSNEKAGVSREPALGPLIIHDDPETYIFIEPMITVIATMVVRVQ